MTTLVKHKRVRDHTEGAWAEARRPALHRIEPEPSPVGITRFIDALRPFADPKRKEQYPYTVELISKTLKELAGNEHYLEQYPPPANKQLEMADYLLRIYEIAEDAKHKELKKGQLDELALNAEGIRQILRDALYFNINVRPMTKKSVCVELVEKTLASVPPDQIADLLGVHRRTLYRWRESEGDAGRRAELLVTLVGLLKNYLTQEGIVAWFNEECELRGEVVKPVDILGQEPYEEALISVARKGLAQHGT